MFAPFKCCGQVHAGGKLWHCVQPMPTVQLCAALTQLAEKMQQVLTEQHCSKEGHVLLGQVAVSKCHRQQQRLVPHGPTTATLADPSHRQLFNLKNSYGLATAVVVQR